MIRPVIIAPDRQLAKVRRLVAHCWQLDGTQVEVIRMAQEVDDSFLAELPHDMHPEQKFACLQAYALHMASRCMNEPFFWLEPDSIPLKEGWLGLIDGDYFQKDKPFLLSSDSNPPHDLVGGIGVYPADCHRYIPDRFERHGFDLWMQEHLNHAIARTSMIQHSYGIYNRNGIAKPHRFPRDKDMIRAEAVIFHRDKYQGLIR